MKFYVWEIDIKGKLAHNLNDISFHLNEPVTLSKVYTNDHKRKNIGKNSLRGSAELQPSVTITDFLEREFPICDVAGGQFGKPLIFTKGNPHL